MRFLIALVALGLLAGCPKPPPKLPDPVPAEELPPPNPEWTRDLPPTLTDVRLHAAQDCVFVTGVDSSTTDRVQICADALTGETRWSHLDSVVSAAHAVDSYFVLEKCLLHAWRERLVCVERTEGKELWSFAGKEGESLYATYVSGETVVVSVDNHRLAVLEGGTGKLVREIPVEDDPLKALATTERGPVAIIVDVRPGDVGEAALAGIDVATGERLWDLPIGTWSYDVQVVSDVLVGWFREGQFWGVNAVSGEVQWRIAEDELPGTPQFGSKHLIVSRAGESLQLLALSPSGLPTSKADWTLTVPSTRGLLGVEELVGDTRALGATLDTFFQYDTATGALRWTYSFNRGVEPGPWTNASSNGDALFLYFEKAGQPGRLKRIPVFAE